MDLQGNFLSADPLSDMSGSESNVENVGGIKWYGLSSGYGLPRPEGQGLDGAEGGVSLGLSRAEGGVSVNTVVDLDTVMAEAVMTALEKMDKVAEQI